MVQACARHLPTPVNPHQSDGRQIRSLSSFVVEPSWRITLKTILTPTLQVVEESQRALAWLQEKEALQQQVAKHEDPVLLSSDIRKKEDTLKRVAEPILTKPPPAPKVHLRTLYLSWHARDAHMSSDCAHHRVQVAVHVAALHLSQEMTCSALSRTLAQVGYNSSLVSCDIAT